MPWNVLQDMNGNDVLTDIVAIHAALLPTSPEGDLLLFGDWDNPGPFTYTRLFRVASSALVTFDEADVPNTNAFCAGHTFLHDGRLLVAGGTLGWPTVDPDEATAAEIAAHEHHYDGDVAVWMYLPRKINEKAFRGVWQQVADMSPQPDNDTDGGGRWYPTLVLLANGQVLAVGGHPTRSDSYNGRHNNNTPERYSPGADEWQRVGGEISAPNSRENDSYPRLHLLPDGQVFFGTKPAGRKRIYNAFAGAFGGPEVDDAAEAIYNLGQNCSSVLLPLLPPDYRPRILLTNGLEAIRIAPGDSSWTEAAKRTGAAAGRRRDHACATILPDGRVLVSGGLTPGSANDFVLAAEIYDPGDFPGRSEEWSTVEAASVGRGYHSVALLLPDGRVFTAGSTESAPFGAEKRIEYYTPSYIGKAGRPQILTCDESVAYGRTFRVTIGGGPVSDVALIRCGSITHAGDSDQRWVGAGFTRNGNTLTVTAPPSPAVAPAGYYMVWVLRDPDTPCQQAAFIRICNQECFPGLELSTYSVLQVRALLPPHTTDTEAVFTESIFMFFDGFLPHEIGAPGDTPSISFAFDNGDPVPGMSIELNRSAWEVSPGQNPDLAQRFTFVYDVVFKNEDAFAAFGDDEVRWINVRGRLAAYECTARINLIKKPNPYMKDGDPPWLSTDLRILKADAAAVEAKSPADAGAAPFVFLQDLLEEYNNAAEGPMHPFAAISESQDDNPIELAVPKSGKGRYNFAVARVRYLAPPNNDAAGVKVFFRLFNTVGTALEYRTQWGYRRSGTDATTIALLGKYGMRIISIPFFGEARVTPGQSMTKQSDNQINRRTLFGEGPVETVVYFGCWLDVNQRTKHFPLLPKDDGPFSGNWLLEGPMREMVELIRGYHQCLVAEIYYKDDPTPVAATPFTSDNLAQRNLAVVESANPGLTATRTVQTTFTVEPSVFGPGPLQSAATVTHRGRPHELMFWRNNLPPGTRITLYFPQVEADEIIELAAGRNGPVILERVDDHTLRFQPGEVTFVPLPVRQEMDIAGLISVTLPTGVAAGQTYRLTVQEYSGVTMKVIGAFQLTIPVKHKAAILGSEVKKLSILRYVAESIPSNDRWYPIFARYLGEIAARVDGFGGDSSDVAPSPHGTGQIEPDVPPQERPPSLPPGDGIPGGDGPLAHHEGKIARLVYDCFGDFEGFVLDVCGDERRFDSTGEPAVEALVRRACHERLTVTIFVHIGDPRRPRRIELHCI